MSRFIDILDKLSELRDDLDVECTDESSLKERLDAFRSILNELSEVVSEANQAGGLSSAMVASASLTSTLNIVDIYNDILGHAKRLSPDSESLAAKDQLDEENLQLEVSWIKGKLPGEVLDEIGEIYNEFEFEVKEEGCFIATAALGDENHTSLIILRIFRDDWLKKSNIGRQFIAVYYRISPSLAGAIENSLFLRATTYILLIKPLVLLISVFLKLRAR